MVQDMGWELDQVLLGDKDLELSWGQLGECMEWCGGRVRADPLNFEQMT